MDKKNRHLMQISLFNAALVLSQRNVKLPKK